VTFWQFLNQWWNLPYLVMLGLVGVFFLMQAVGLVAHAAGSGHETDADVGGADPDADVDHDADVAHEADADHDADVAHEADADHDADADHGHDADHDHGLAAFFGIGRVPFMVVWLTLFIFAGFTGIFLNRVLQVRAGEYRGWFFPLSALASLGVGAVSVKFAASAIAKLVDVGGRGCSARRELSGAVGVVASPVLDHKFGEVRVHDSRGNELIVHGHLGDGDRELKQGDKVVLIDLENDSGLFHVAALKE
jgi:Protein of unknown function (DUF1449)